ncbi:AAA family ATPase [Usitatibacter palustris]|uniref:AAA family ATPase n=1 Tax=Usitatibacter palustris TaxID=2732487 RepID=UPI001487D4FE|nr:AAA family ATPase [Usitatibacter palustris]
MSNTSKSAGISYRVRDVSDLVMHKRMVEALEAGQSRYPIYRKLRFAARVELEVLFDAIALDPAWRAERMYTHALMLDGDGVFVSAYGNRKPDYCSCRFFIWAADPQRAEAAKELILSKAAATRIREPMFKINWQFLTGRGEVENAEIEEMVDEAVIDEAYPEIAGGVKPFIERYLDSKESVLVLQGPPGTGKTRLIRAILGEIARRKDDGETEVVYTGDMRALESDEIFVKFITGWDDAFVVEDADHLLKPRCDGNEHLHRFLTIADGVVRAQGRKIIFSTNLPNVGDLDEALIRPGRCFARVHVRTLTTEEARIFATKVAAGDPAKLERAAQAFAAPQNRSHSLASVYQMLQ